ncbi:MAG TPA: transglutaminase-like domain-containing protein [Spirochaetota bacterium]|jgi:transglutaminase-like putative cysteine protease|nr:transglutaminase-like domain-containing protein [Spirochaetota bacterium]HOR92649.1 transglutaminase-like domain-containing protein [Spirochaetota bacterium]HOT18994.1 transglutaminase-like domain-containing protein [Spirochaetota bacterium]HPD04116.1 transglutaminase-like domain-containing protein [Spirochaetota bacterium]HQG41591.1 transglutaminase-like domain-containing protein [Spirochaetota bacterium]
MIEAHKKILIVSMPMVDSDLKLYLAPSRCIDSDDPLVVDFAHSAIGSEADAVKKSVKLFYAVRDNIYYDPYSPFYKPEHYHGRFVLQRGRGFCVSKASLLCALARACNIPSRVGFATVKNHIATKQLLETLGTNVFAYHGFTEFYLNKKWVKATPAFNKELCILHKVSPIEFNGVDDAIFPEYNSENKLYMEYLDYHGSFYDVPVETIITAWKECYGSERVELWITLFEQNFANRKFEGEEIVK